MATTVFSYKNWVGELTCTITATVNSFETDAPLDNLKTPRLGQLAIATAIGSTAFEIDWGLGSPQRGARVDVIALLNHNILEFPTAAALLIDVYDTEGGSYVPAGFPISLVNTASDGQFQNHLIWNMGNTDGGGPDLDRDKVSKIVIGIGSNAICGTRNPYTGEITREPFQCGGVWAGPRFQPENGISIGGFAHGIVDNSQVVKSIGGQVWAEPEVRQRSMKLTFAGLLENEVYALAPNQCLQQLAAHCGLSRPLIVVPTTSDEDLVYTQGLYGYLTSMPSWDLAEKTKDATTGQMVRLYTGALEILEAR